jgi:Xaa-Pro dipeptidase
MTALRNTRLSATFYRTRITRIQHRLSEEMQLGGLLVLDPSNVIYTCGFFHIPSERPLGLYIPVVGNPVLFVPLLEKENAAATWIGDIRTYFEYPGEENPVLWMARESGAVRLGVDSISHTLFVSVGGLGLPLTVTPLIEQMRWIKEPEELELVAQAAAYADFCLNHIYEHAADIIRGGGTELDILSAGLAATKDRMQREIEETFDLHWGTVVGTVHSGPRAALPHGRPMERVPKAGETLIAGIGAMVGGYHAESGATFILGEPTADQMHCLRTVAACNDAAIAMLNPGKICAEVNEAALAVLREAGLGDAIRHRIGHGMGLQGHEGPWLAPGDLTALVPNMVFSNEPGIYRPSIDGYRTINSMIVTESVPKIPSRFLAAHPPERCIVEL